MKEKYGGLWINVKQDDSAEIIFESFDKEKNVVFVVYKRKDGGFTPYYFKLHKDYQYSLPIWSKENEKSIYSSFEEAKLFLEKVVGNDI